MTNAKGDVCFVNEVNTLEQMALGSLNVWHKRCYFGRCFWQLEELHADSRYLMLLYTIQQVS
jgi:hypothetical protein